MQSSENVAKISAALVKAQAHFKAVGKSGENKFDKYSYANLEDYVKTVRPVLDQYGLSLVSSVEEVVALPDRQTSNGKSEHAVRVKLVLRIVHDSGEWIEAVSWGEGQDRADKSVYKAITGARKYALASALGLATSDDPEADETVGAAEPPRTTKGPDETERFIIAVGEALDAREIRRVPATDRICKGYNVNDLSDIPSNARKQVLKGIAAGKLDNLKPETAAAGK